MHLTAALIFFCAGGGGALWAAPANDPVHVELPIYDQPQSSSSVQLAQPLEVENHPGEQSKNAKVGILGNLISQKVKAASSVLGQGSKGIESGTGLFATPVRMREDALQETEGWGSKTLSIKENIHKAVTGIFQPKPIVDTIQEEEKYGNSGDKFYAAGKAVVAGTEGVSNLFNTILEVPSNIIKKIARVATEKLNNFGGKLIGLK